MPSDKFINPYNFVSIKGKVEKNDRYNSHHQFDGSLNSGIIECSLEVKKPVFIPDPEATYFYSIKNVNFNDDDDPGNYQDGDEVVFEEKDDKIIIQRKINGVDDNVKSEARGRLVEIPNETGAAKRFKLKTTAELKKEKGHKVMNFFRIGERPAIPSTSLKGMVRSVAEAASNSCLSQMSTSKLEHRYSRLGSEAIPAIVEMMPTPGQQGILRKFDGIAWVSLQKLRNLNLNFDNTGDFVYVIIERKIKNKPWGSFPFLDVTNIKNIKESLSENAYEAILKITGKNADNKHHERVFYSNKYKSNLQANLQNLGEIEFSQEIAEAYNNRVKILKETQPATKLQSRRLAEGDLVYVYDSGGDIALSPVLVPKLADKFNPFDLLEKSHKPCCDIKNSCPSCKLFGLVSEKKSSYAGKVAFHLAAYDRDVVASEPSNHLPILATPHASCEQFYLLGTNGNNDRVYHYDKRWLNNATEGEPRGRKFYWHHRPHPKFLTDEEHEGKRDNQNQRSTVEIIEGGEFHFKVNFTNLTNYELGLLLYSLRLDKGMRHKLGMGKPLGMGTVHITIDTLHLIDRRKRYESLLNTGFKQIEAAGDDGYEKKYIQAFKSRQAKAAGVTDFKDLSYIKDLRAIMTPKDFNIDIKYPNFVDNRRNSAGFVWFQKNKDQTLPTITEVNKKNPKTLTGWQDNNDNNG